MENKDNQKAKRLAGRLISLAAVIFVVAPLVQWLISGLRLGPLLSNISTWSLLLLIGFFVMAGGEMIARRLGWYSSN